MRTRSDWAKRLAAIVKEKGGNRAALSKRAKLNPTWLRDVLDKGSRPTLENAQKFSDALEVPVTDWYLDPEGRDLSVIMERGDTILEIGGVEFARLPIYDIRMAAGAGAQNYEEDPIDYHLLSVNFLRTLTDAPPKMIAGFQAEGTSMEETIYDRDWCFADLRKRKLYNPGIFALAFEGEGLLKRAAQHLESKAVTLISDNPSYPPQTIKKPDQLEVIGRVIFSIRRH
jgi:phage repressor protein C with HTH and peptisase S24 domain